ncbi:transient receptor potential cation channel subfamily V member 3-like [Mercenaria mercenaria]|uniref:transient receptor potential cation channel subfamily V member 3-like n=1 Tax=Mercenaria mercenaria TaxID=6596 RepID=UPI00234EA462|nr:transient receptor potential cation channel subfamily V member 3-like [Mercenaria mercenaria]
MTPIHLAILKEDILLLKQMAKYIETAGDNRVPKEKVHGLCASGPVFQNTVMMAGTPLGVAALKLNKDIFDVVLYKFAPGLDVTNAKGDNLVHLLIKYAHIHPKQLNKVLEMLRYILDWKIQTNSEEEVARKLKTKKQTRKLLMMTNKEKLNPLHFAVKRRQYDIFEYIMKNDVYHSKESSDGLFNEEVYDITDIETLRLDNDISGTDEEIIKSDYHESVLEYLVHQETENAFLFADFMRVKEVIREKWMIYRWWFMGWFIIHLICMVLLSVAAVFRSKLKEIEKSGNFTESISVNSEAIYTYAVTKNAFVTGVSVTGLVFGLLYIAMEMTRKFLFRFQFQSSSNCLTRITRHLSSPYSNLIFRIYFILFSLLLISDCILAAIHGSDFISGYENYCLIFAIIIGWYLVMFFLQTIKPFSFFTVLIQRVVLDMMKFAFVMTFFLLAFSIAMFMIMQGANTDDDDFKYFGKTIVKMLTIMLGIGELGILFQARHPVLAILVFVLFVLLTTILLLNAR